MPTEPHEAALLGPKIIRKDIQLGHGSTGSHFPDRCLCAAAETF